MKKLLFILVAFTAFGCSKRLSMSSSSHQLVGSWQMVSMKYTYPDGRVMERKDFKYPALKMYNEHAFYSFGRQKNSGEIDDAGGGKYQLVGDTLISIPEYHTVSSFVGKPTKFHVKFEKDKFYQTGVLLNEIKIEEVYVRLK